MSRLIQQAEQKNNMRLVQDFDARSTVPPGCGAIFQQAEQESFDLAADWFKLLSETALTEQQLPKFFVIGDERGAHAILPLLIPANAASPRLVTSLTNFYSTLFRPLFSEEAKVEDIADALRKIASDNRAYGFRFDAMDPDHSSYAKLEQALRLAGMLPFRFFGFGNWYLQAESLTWESYLKQLSGNRRYTLKRMGKKFEEAGGRFTIVTGQESDLNEVISAYLTVYASSWKVPEPFPDFIPGFVNLCARLGWLRMGVAYIEDQPVAAQFWLVSHGRACIYKVAYDEKFASFSPGNLLTAQLMRHVLDIDKVREVDFLIGDDNYKQIWMSHRRERWGIVAYNTRTVKGLVLAMREAAARAMKPYLAKVRESISKVKQRGK